MKDLSILMPARNEMFLKNTVEDILSKIEADTEIIVYLDGSWADPPLVQNDRVTVIHSDESIGQRAATNKAALLSKAKYVMKCDAHCSFDKGFDRKMIEAFKGHDNWTMVPLMKNLHAFDWVCKKGHRRYQGPSGLCAECGKETKRDIVWIAKDSPKSVSYCFDSTPHFQYFGEFSKRPEGKGTITPTMSLQGSCWMLTRQKYWELNICDEKFGSWGSQGIEVAVKTWLSGGEVLCNQNTWYAHMFRTQGGDFGFPYPLSGSQVAHAKTIAKDLFFNNKWEKQIRPLSWLIEKFWPVKGWSDEDLKRLKFTEKESLQVETEKGIIFYTDNQLNLKIAHKVQKNLRKIELPIVSASLKPMTFGHNIHLPLTRGYLTMFKQILAALKASKAKYVFFCEHDVLYHPSHFEFTPPDDKVFYYNENVWKLNTKTGKALHYDCKQVSGICVNRKTAVKHYQKRIKRIEEFLSKNPTNGKLNKYIRLMGFEPGTHRRAERVDDLESKSWKSKYAIVDIRHDKNLTPSRWKKSEFRNKSNTKGWTESDQIPGWGKIKETFPDILNKA